MTNIPPAAEELIPLGQTGLRVKPIGTGAWAWGDRLVWGFGKGYDEADIEDAFRASLQAGINFFDTAEIYGFGRSERLLGQYLPQARQPLVIASKFFPLPWRVRRSDLLRALRGSLKRLGLERLDLYQFHWPAGLRSTELWAEALGDAVESGLTRAVGVSNYSTNQMRRTADVLARRGFPLASNQVEYHLLDRRIERSGLLAACQEMNVALIAYSPLAMGILTGKYTPENPPPGTRGRRYSVSYLADIQPLVERMRQIGTQQGGKTPAQVAINWCICKGTIPIPGAKNARQVQDNAGALGWRLSAAEVAELDELSDHVDQSHS